MLPSFSSDCPELVLRFTVHAKMLTGDFLAVGKKLSCLLNQDHKKFLINGNQIRVFPRSNWLLLKFNTFVSSQSSFLAQKKTQLDHKNGRGPGACRLSINICFLLQWEVSIVSIIVVFDVVVIAVDFG